MSRLSFLLPLLLPAAALAQTVEAVRFSAGNYGTMVEGQVTGNAYADYTLGASAGQEMFVELEPAGSTGNGSVYFNILPPGSDGVAIYNGSMNGNSTTVELPESGTYTIRVYQMGNDKDAGATTDFRMDLSIQ